MKFRLEKPANHRVGRGVGPGVGGAVADPTVRSPLAARRHSSLVVLLLPLLLSFARHRASALLDEREVLYHVYANLNGDNWDKTWDTDSPDVCDYHGVECNDAGRITKIVLRANNLAGSVSPHVYTLPHLRELDLSGNRITSAGFDRIDVVVEEEDDIGSVEVIDLSHNLVSSVKGVSKLAESLTGLHLTANNLKGAMPAELFQIPLLEILSVSENELTGTIDKRLWDLTKLQEFYSVENKLTGTIPSEIGQLTKMRIITFAENQLTGPLPAEIKNMGNLQTFSVHNNDPGSGTHTGPLPLFDEHPYLDEIYLDGNAFSGTIPHNFLGAFNGSQGETVTMSLANNNLTGTIPGEFARFDSLVLNVVGNRITGYGPGICDDDSNEDDAAVGGWMNGMVELFGCDAILCPADTYSDTGRQEESGTPCEPCDSGTGGFMGATSCEGGGKVVNGTDDELEVLVELYLALNGPQWIDVDGWSAFAEMESPADLTLPSYQDEGIDPCSGFTGIACDEDGSIQVVSLPNNGLEGMVPSSFFNLPNLRELDLSGNEIRLDRDNGFGEIGRAVRLRKADLSSNDIEKFSGIGKATSLEELVVNDAYFFGPIDTELYQLTELRVLELKFSGLKKKIPEGISDLFHLKNLDLYGNEMTGTIPPEIGLLTKLWHVDFSENDFSGTLPTNAIAKLLDLQKFHVKQSGKLGPGITGKLPSFKEQKLLHMLDLNSNSMTGSIPSDFLSGVTNVDQLMAIDIGYNQLTGTVPGSLSRFTNMRLFAIKNKIVKVSTALCSLRGWLNDEVGKVIDAGGNGCDAILCPKGTFNSYGRQTSGGDGACKSCPDGEYAGATGCIGITDESDNLEKKILDKIFVETNGVNWTKKEHWETGPVCAYQGVTCSGNSTNEGVEEIDLTGFGLISDIPTQIYQLPYLKKIVFSNNVVGLKFDGIDDALNLEEIIMNMADLTSVEGISSAPSLKRLHISHNSFPKGTIPAELYSIETLELLDISSNGFSGSLPGDIANLENLQEFYAGGNDITGTIPKEISQLSQLTKLVLSGNRMSGEIPNELEDIRPLRLLHLNGQRDFGGFTGKLPNFTTSLHLHEIDLSKNSLTGSIPSSFLEAVRKSGSHDDYAYDKIDLSSNQITGTVPVEWDDFVGLFAYLAGNRITGVPSVLCDDDDEFMDCLVGNLTTNKCDAILCPPGTSSPEGRQIDASVPCQPCPGETAEERELQAPYFGMLACKPHSAERSILEQLYGLIFTDSSVDTHWITDYPICSWYGITCEDETADTGVTEVKLESNSLETDDPDKVSALFFALPNLKKLDLRGNDKLQLKLDDVWKSTQLESLHISATGITSIVGIGMATNLKELHVTDNDMTGPFPEEIFNLTSMERLYLSFNQISGKLPTRIGELTNLREFYAYTNDMTGELPTELGNLAEIENLVLGKNNFEGNLPTQLNNLVNLREFSVYKNEKLSGPILAFSKVTKLEKLDLEGNGFTGQIPSSFLNSLESDYIANSENKIVLHLADNALTGEIPDGLLSKIANLYLDIVGNQFTEVPLSFCKKEQSLWMDKKVGELQDDNPCYAIACPVNTFSDTGRMDSDEDDECTACGSDEEAPFVGSRACIRTANEISALKALYRATNGDSWNENENWMDHTKPICTWHGVVCAGDSLDNHTVTGIDLSANSLNGTMPHQIWELPALQSLNLKENEIFVHFTNIYKAKKLELLYISDIDIGSIDGIGKAPALTELHLTGNELTGELPSDFFELADTLESLYIAYNSFSGTLSTEFGKMTKLVDFYAYDNEFTGSIPAEFATLKNLKNFVVAENKLAGSIPEEFSYMPQLELFSAYRRLKAGPKLSGYLPSFSNVPSLYGLYVDYNHLVGTIPSNFLKSSLNTELITISHNLLTGEVPLELAQLNNLHIEMEGNKFTDMDERFCEKLDWMDGLVSNYSCDALMCPPGYFSIIGRQNSTESACQKCDASATPPPYWGSISCDGVVDDKEILELLYSETKGSDWHNNENWLTADDICTWYGVECRDGVSVQAIRLGANNLVGTPPKEIFLLKQLHTLWLNSNPIAFKFEGIGKAQNLIDLRLDATGLRDTFGVGEAKHLIKLDVKYNELSGGFPFELLKLEKLESLSLTDNSLTGELPVSYGKLVNLIELRLGSNLFSGELSSFSDLGSLILLDLSENDLRGSIPNDFLSSISGRKPILVDLSSNGLSGIVPHHLDRLDKLVIYLRDNKFHQLPSSLCDSNNRAWNMREVEMFGCDAIMCPPGTANFHGRKSAANIPCMKCESNKDFYGQISCNGVPLEVSSSLRLLLGRITAFTFALGGVLLIQFYM